MLGRPRLHLREIGSTNARARELAMAGAPHGTLVTARAQVAGRGRQGRSWSATPGRSLAMSLVLRDPPRLLPLVAAAAVADVAGDAALVKWPNDVLIDGRKVAGILAEGRLQDGWAVLGIGLNVAIREEDLPEELRATAGTLGLEPSDVEPTLERLLSSLAEWLGAPEAELLSALRTRDALAGRSVRWADGAGVARGIDDAGRLVVELGDGSSVELEAGEVHLSSG